jgi:hypothetical protein
MHLMLFLLVAYGIAFGLMNDKTPLSAWLRNRQIGKDADGLTFFTRMLSCPYCTGFHAGWIAWLAVYMPQHAAGLKEPIAVVVAHVVACAFASSAWCYVVDAAAQWLEDAAAAARNSLDD